MLRAPICNISCVLHDHPYVVRVHNLGNHQAKVPRDFGEYLEPLLAEALEGEGGAGLEGAAADVVEAGPPYGFAEATNCS